MATLIFVALGTGSQTAGYSARIPDLPGLTPTGADMAELLANARTAVLQELQRLADDGQEWPTPTAFEAIAPQAGALPFLVDVDVDDPAVRVNISIGERLLKRIDQAAETRGMSRSAFIAAASRKALGDKAGGSGADDFEAIARKLQDEWSVLGRKLTESLGPDSAFNRHVAQFDDRVADTVKRAADNISSAIARRKRSTGPMGGPAGQPADASTADAGL